MIYLFIIAYLVLAFLVYMMFKVLKKSVTKIDEQSKTYYVDKLQEYDEIIDDKEQKINDLNKEIKNKKLEAEKIKNEYNDSKIDFDINIIDLLSRTKYQEKDFFELERAIQEKFNYNNEKIIKEFIKHINTSKNYEFCKNLRRKFNNSNIYELKTLGDEELKHKIKEMLSKKEYQLFESFIKTHTSFNLEEFIIFLEELEILNDPKITVYVGNKKENYDHINKYIKTKVDKNIYKGIKIKYQSKIYDFSLNGRNL